MGVLLQGLDLLDTASRPVAHDKMAPSRHPAVALTALGLTTSLCPFMLNSTESVAIYLDALGVRAEDDHNRAALATAVDAACIAAREAVPGVDASLADFVRALAARALDGRPPRPDRAA